MTGQLGDWQVLALILAGAMAGGFVNGLTGFGTALTGLPLWLQALEPLLAAQLASACSILGHVATLPQVWQRTAWRQMAPMLVGGLLGVPVGTWLLPLISLPTFKLAVGLVLIGYCTFMLVAAGRVRAPVGGPAVEAAVGLGGGVLGGIAGLSGIFPTVYAALTGWPKAERRIMFQIFNFLILSAMLMTSIVHGSVGIRFLLALAVAVPGTLIGSWLGVAVYHRLDDRRFDRLVLLVLLISGLGLVWSSR
jgi:uncharacterized membrane protein YfcA